MTNRDQQLIDAIAHDIRNWRNGNAGEDTAEDIAIEAVGMTRAWDKAGMLKKGIPAKEPTPEQLEMFNREK